MPYEAEWIIDNIRSHGYEAFIVGGCVRDAVLGRIPGDWDITTSAKPEQVKEIFGKTVDTGLKHGTVTMEAAMRSPHTGSTGSIWTEDIRRRLSLRRISGKI